MVDASPALLEQLADSVVVVVGVVDAAREVLADELAFAVRGVDLGVEEVAGARPGEVAGPRGLRAVGHRHGRRRGRTKLHRLPGKLLMFFENVPILN